MAFPRDQAYISGAVLRGATETYSRGLTILKGAVPDRAPGSGHMAPTYFCRFPGSQSDGSCGSALSIFVIARLPQSGVTRQSTSCKVLSFSMSRRVKLGDDDRSEMSDSISELKSIVRKDALMRRDAIPAAERAQAAETIAARAFPLAVGPGMVVSGFMPLKTEINPLPLMRKLAAAGAQLALPAIAGRGKPLVMRAFAFGDELASGQWGIREPKPDAPEVVPDILLVPLLAFDRIGHRVGYGAGYYDMTIMGLRARKAVVAVGIAFAAQEIARVPTTARDAPLDLVLTEHEIIDCRAT